MTSVPSSLDVLYMYMSDSYLSFWSAEQSICRLDSNEVSGRLWLVPDLLAIDAKMSPCHKHSYRITGPLWRDFTGHRCIPLPRSHFFFIASLNRRLNKQSNYLSCKTQWHPYDHIIPFRLSYWILRRGTFYIYIWMKCLTNIYIQWQLK